jgi:hypothetical protein
MGKEHDSLTAGIAKEVLEMRYGMVRISECIISFSPSFVSKIFSVVGFLPISIVGDEKHGSRNYYGYCDKFESLGAGDKAPIYNLHFNVNRLTGIAEVSVMNISKKEDEQKRIRG